ncbi:MAG: hypothetical protein LQ342_006473 [Letrouitia transgressa]|nr:MAG: hypothetical protein LQ342_006473 [Letrouitia transgressa]
MSTPANDSFSNLISFQATQTTKNLSLQELQKLKEGQRQKLHEQRFGEGTASLRSADGDFLEQLGSGKSTPMTAQSPPPDPATSQYKAPNQHQRMGESVGSGYLRKVEHHNGFPNDDLLGGIEETRIYGTPETRKNGASREISPSPLGNGDEQNDDDPFGLGTMSGPIKPRLHQPKVDQDNDDVLGLLGRPVSRKAHEESGKKSEGSIRRDSPPLSQKPVRSPPRRASGSGQRKNLAWMKEGTDSTDQRRHTNRSSANVEKDPSKIAAEIGSHLFRTANSLWKSGTKKLNQAVADFNSESDPSQPKWMQEPRHESQNRTSSQPMSSRPKVTQARETFDSDLNQPKWMQEPRHESQNKTPSQSMSPRPKATQARETPDSDSSQPKWTRELRHEPQNRTPSQPMSSQPKATQARETPDSGSSQPKWTRELRHESQDKTPSQPMPSRLKATQARETQQPKVAAPPTPKRAIPPTSSASLISSTKSRQAEAVTRLRAANQEAERLDDEKFALADQVSERVAVWRAGKESNLRALLASLDTVLWEEAGWKKVGMGELIVASKVKVAYMKGIAKVHPDKLPQTATTEQRMVSAAVFATLNEAWDGFKKENGL